ncbi:DNA-binding CsgD family transcriptional regulator [Sinorhizobium kostiense]|uniref:DNA-binding CsgD family transcriptional regulator n=1 Tax=Sinorhizobium kostiense TaxID=76747 RepID=A0ABS4R364_9HYPH|nr:helix-turn-helix transcriptional regulator [Sinorhizobium kostiense]MBP2237316.1 DNA-binding CsgD family transcriptional regulator [Sinorhizobium kostiense]
MMDAFDQLTPLELRCLALAALGRARLDIMRETDIPLDRIDGALAEATRKLKAGNLAEAVCRALRLKLIHNIQWD